MEREIQDVVSELKSLFESKANASRADKMAAYMKNHFAFYGIPSPERKSVLSLIWNECSTTIKVHWRDIVQWCWNQKEREYQYFAMDIMSKVKKEYVLEDIDIFQTCLTRKSWWDTVDFLASNMVGTYFQLNNKSETEWIYACISSDNLWLNRTAMLYQLKYKNEINLNILSKSILTHIDSREFFIQKGAGWALRQVSKDNPRWVKEFIKKNPHLSRLTIREASKYLRE